MNYRYRLIWALILANIAVLTGRRIFSGRNSAQNQFPYVAYVSSYFTKGGVGTCTGSVLSNEWILTAAHCFVNGTDWANKVSVCIGMADMYSKQECHYVIQQITHKDYNKIYSIQDVALLKIPYVAYAPNIQNIKLPSFGLREDDKKYKPKNKYRNDNEKVTAIGWGRTGDSPDIPNVLQWTTFTVYSNEDCKEMLDSIIEEDIVVALLRDQQMCTGSSVSNVCPGDSGGPLVSSNNVLIGVETSTTAEKCTTDLLAFYARITSCLQWIFNNTGIKYA